MKLTLLLALCACASAVLGAPTAVDTRLLRFPDISRSEIAFVYAGDLYSVKRNGGDAKRLTSHSGLELFPKFSPDGKWLAFSAEYSGTRQVYVMPSDASSAPKQLTWYNDIGPMPPRGGFDYRVLDWTADGKHVVVRMNRLGFDERAGRPYLVPAAGGDEQPLAVPETGGGMLSPDGSKFVYTPIDREFRTWKHHRGGRAQDVWIYDLVKNTSLRLTEDPATDNQPVWIGETVYFTSDRDFTLNLYAVSETGGTARKVTVFDEFDVLWPSAGPDALVFENGGWLYSYSPADQAPQKVSIRVLGDRPGTLPQIKNVSAQIESFAVAPKGERALFAARGELFSAPAKHGEVRNLSLTPGEREISLSISPDGKRVAYLSDASGEYELYWRFSDGSGTATRLTDDGKAWRFAPVWSNDGKHLLLGDSENALKLISLMGSEQLVDRATVGNAISDYRFSADGAQIAYSKTNTQGLAEIWFYNVQTKEKAKVLGGQFNAYAPSFDPLGRYLYFVSDRDHNLVNSSYEFNYLYTNSARLFVTTLSAETQPLIAEKSDEIGQESLGDDSANKTRAPGAVRWDPAGLAARTVALPIGSGAYQNLQASEDALYYLHNSNADDPLELRRYELASEKTENVFGAVLDYKLSSSGQKLLIKLPKSWVITDAKAAVDTSKPLDLQHLDLRIDPALEWPQIYADALRVLREWFYDENLHGNDWRAVERKYAPLLQHVAHRSDLDYILGEIAGELRAGHVYVERGDELAVERHAGGLLGGEFSKHPSGYYQVSKIFEGQNWSEDFRAPLAAPGVDIKTGDFILAINGRSARAVTNFYELLENQGARLIEITVNAKPSLQGARTVRVKTIVAETQLRYLEWIAQRADLVDKLSNGRIGYIHLPNTAIEGNRELFKQLPSQINKAALIIDDRYNGGGFIPDRMIEILSRKPLNRWKRRGLEPQATPFLSHDGPKAMLINGLSSSGGDALPYYFRKLQLGPLIGTRTWGGLIGISGNPGLVDGGTVLAATFRFLGTDGRWAVENEGVAPDIEVIDRPELLSAGRDPSVEKAVEVLLAKLKEQPPAQITTPVAPNDFGQPKQSR